MVADGAMPIASIGAFPTDALAAAVLAVQRGHVKDVATSGAGRGIVIWHDGHAVPARPPDPQKKQ